MLKPLCGCFESEPLSWLVIQSVGRFSYYLLGYISQGHPLRQILANEFIGIFIGTSFPAAILFIGFAAITVSTTAPLIASQDAGHRPLFDLCESNDKA